MHSIKAFVLALLILAAAAHGQPSAAATAADDEKLRKEAVEFLRESIADVNNLRTLENRISFTSELASLMWYYDEREARGMFGAVIGNFRDLMTKYDYEMNQFGLTPEEPNSGGFFMETSDKSKLLRRFQAAMAVRQQIASSLAEHDPELAISFYTDSLAGVTNAELRKQLEGRDSYFEQQLIEQIALKDPAKAAAFAVKSLANGVNYGHITYLQKLREKDPDKAVEFGAAIVRRLKQDIGKFHDFFLYSSLLSVGENALDESKEKGGKRAIYTQAELREIAELLAQAILANENEYGSSGVEYADLIERYSASRAAQIRAKFRNRRPSYGNSAYPYNTAVNAANYAANAVPGRGRRRRGGYANTNSVYYSNTNSPYYSNSNSDYYSIANSANTNANASPDPDQRLYEDLQGLENKNLSKEERRRIINEARKSLATGQTRDRKVMELCGLAAAAARGGDRELADELLRDAERLVDPQPRTYQDFILTWMLVSGFAEAAPERAFPLLEDTIGRLNETISAFVKVAEFIDAGGEMIQDGEVQVGSFGGSMIRGVTGELGIASNTLRALARSDFAKTRGLVNRFDRTEARVLARMMILRAVLDRKEKLLEPDLPNGPVLIPPIK